MKKFILATTLLFSSLTFAAGKIQNADVKSLAELQAAGATGSSLINDTKIWMSSVTPAQQLSTAVAAGLIGGGGGNSGKNYLSNAGFEGGAASFTVSGATATANTSDYHDGSQSLSLALSAAGSVLQSPTIGTNLNGTNMEAGFWVKTSVGTASVCYLQGATEVACNPVPATGQWVYVPANGIGPSSGTQGVKLKWSSTSGTILVDQGYLGQATNLTNVAQAVLVGAVKIFCTGGGWGNNLAPSYSSLGVSTGCTYDTAGEALAPLTQKAGIRFNSLPPGEYMIQAEGDFVNSVANSNYSWKFTDGTNFAREDSNMANQAGASHYNGITQSIAYSSAQGPTELEIYTRADNSGTPAIIANTSVQSLVIKVYRFPTTTNQAYNAALYPWKVDATIVGGNLNLGTGNIVSPAVPESGTLTLTNVAGAGNIQAQMACASGESPSGATCTGNETSGLSYIQPVAGDVKVCASFSHNIQISNGGAASVFNIFETNAGDYTILQTGKGPVQSETTTGTGVNNTFPHMVCSTFSTGTGRRTFRLGVSEQVASGGVTDNAIGADGALGGRNIHFTVTPITQSVTMPIIVGSVSSSTAGREQLERATIGNGTTAACTIVSQSGSWISTGTRNGNGDCTWPVTGFSGIPTCTCTVRDATSADACFFAAVGQTSVQLITRVGSSGANTDENAGIICMGPK